MRKRKKAVGIKQKNKIKTLEDLFGSCEIQVDEFICPENDIPDLIKSLTDKLRIKTPLFKSLNQAIRWLNESSIPYEMFNNCMSKSDFDDTTRECIKNIEKVYNKSLKKFSNRELKELTITHQGQRLKRFILLKFYRPKYSDSQLLDYVKERFSKYPDTVDGRVNKFLNKKKSSYIMSIDNLKERKKMIRLLLKNAFPREIPIEIFKVKKERQKINKDFDKVRGYEKRIKEILSKGIIIFSRKDEDGKERDYFGFPTEMILKVRQRNLLGSWKESPHANAVLNIYKKIDQTTKKNKKKKTRQRDEILTAIYKIGRKKNLRPNLIMMKIKQLNRTKKLILPEGTKLPSLKTLQHIQSKTIPSKSAKKLASSLI